MEQVQSKVSGAADQRRADRRRWELMVGEKESWWRDWWRGTSGLALVNAMERQQREGWQAGKH